MTETSTPLPPVPQTKPLKWSIHQSKLQMTPHRYDPKVKGSRAADLHALRGEIQPQSQGS